MDQPPSPPPPKRARTVPVARGQDDYAPGNIIEIELHNFMTYVHLTTKPGPRLNLVIGPNGTGKSSLVCAICIGLGGDPQLLGRAKEIGDYVKRGEESGWVKICLRGSMAEKNVAITRKINTRNKSDWLINDRPATKIAVQELVQKFNIQLNNLTQFLPQDRVSEFAKMTPVLLLEETEKAVGDPELYAHHQTLIKRSEELKKLQTTVTQLESALEQNKKCNLELEEDGQRMRQRNELLGKAESMKKKLPWLRYDVKRKAFETSKEAERQAKAQLCEALERARNLKAPLETLKAKRKSAEEASQRSLNSRSAAEQKMRQIADHETELGTKVRSKLAEIQEVHRREAIRQERIEKAQQEVARAEADLANLPDYVPPTENIQAIAAQLHELQMAAGEKRSLRQEKERHIAQAGRAWDECHQRLEDINSVNSRLLQTLERFGAPGICEAYKWVQSQRSQNMFKKEVYGPVLLEVRIADKTHATYVENHVAGHIWKSFITQDPEDRDFLVRNLKRFSLPVINQRSSAPNPPRPVTHEMRQLGITARLDQVINAPDVVKQMLCGQSGLEFSFIGTSETNQRADEAQRIGVSDLWTPENHYRWSTSRYGGHVSANVRAVRQVRLFSENVDDRAKNELEQRLSELNESIVQLEAEREAHGISLRQLDEKAAKLHRAREDLTNQMRQEKKKRADLTSIIEQRRKKLLMFENEECSTVAERKLRASIQQINSERCQNMIKLKEVLLAAAETQMQYAGLHLHVIELDAQIKEMEKEARVHDAFVMEVDKEYNRCKLDTEGCRKLLVITKETAERDASLTPQLRAQFEKMPESVQELEEAIGDCIDKANAVICNNPNVLEEYDRRCQQIETLTMKVRDEKIALDRCLNDIERLQDSWLPRLRDLVSKINETFSRNFMEMAVAGEVSLGPPDLADFTTRCQIPSSLVLFLEHGDECGTDFDKYGILIKVKFRETGALQVLSAHHQSGGERSVSTILYLVSLQDLTYCPFRVVDEINQGMDPNNERKMFQQLVRAASQPNTPQCLLLTPKLLPDLEYTDACTVLNIMNGPWLGGTAEAWSSGQSWSYMSQMICSQ